MSIDRDLLNQAYISPDQSQDLQCSYNENSLLDIADFYLERSQPSDLTAHHINDTTRGSAELMVKCEHYAVNRLFYVINTSREIVESVETPNQSAHHYSSVKEDSTVEMTISFLLFASQDATDHAKSVAIEPAERAPFSKPTQKNDEKATTGFGTKLKKLAKRFTKKFRPHKMAKSCIQAEATIHKSRAFERKASQFVSTNYELDCIFANDSSEFQILGDFVTYYV
jgi:hypothetical protein